MATARRDLEALSTARVPVYPQPGRGGGWSLVGGARTDLSGLTAYEAPGGRTLPAGQVGLCKLVQALPRTFRSDAEAAAGAVVVDPVPWGSAVVRVPPSWRSCRNGPCGSTGCSLPS